MSAYLSLLFRPSRSFVRGYLPGIVLPRLAKAISGQSCRTAAELPPFAAFVSYRSRHLCIHLCNQRVILLCEKITNPQSAKPQSVSGQLMGTCFMGICRKSLVLGVYTAPSYRKTDGRRWGASPPTCSGGFCGRRGPFRTRKPTIFGRPPLGRPPVSRPPLVPIRDRGIPECNNKFDCGVQITKRVSLAARENLTRIPCPTWR